MRLQKFSILVTLCASTLIAFPASAMASQDCVSLARNLSLGMKGDDVKLLQEVLNANPQTRLALSGPGSLGNETTHFGQITKNGVIKFQDLYRAEVLVPVGFSSGNGFVGKFTRAKLVQLCKSRVALPVSTASSLVVAPPVRTPAVPVSSTPSPTSPVIAVTESILPVAVSNVLYVKFPDTYVLNPGDTFELFGGGFTSVSNTVHIGTQEITGVKSTDGSTLRVPLSPVFATGKHDVWVTNASGKSEKTFIVVVAKGTIAPFIRTVIPATIGLNEQVTITGEQFSKDWNEIYVGETILKVASPDGKTLTFTPKISVTANINNAPPLFLPLWFFIVNPNGISDSAVVTVKI